MLIFWGDLRLLSQILSVDTVLEDGTNTYSNIH